MKALITLSLLMMITLSAQSQTYEKIKASFPSSKYKLNEKKFSSYFDFIKTKEGTDLGYDIIKFYVEGYYKCTYGYLDEILDDVTPEKVNLIVAKFLASDLFERAFPFIESGLSKNKDGRLSKDNLPLKERFRRVKYDFEFSIQGAEALGVKGVYTKYIEGVIERAYIKSQKISL